MIAVTENKLIAHALIKLNNKFLIIKRTKIKRNQPNVFPDYWDIPGGTVENGELPQEAAKREVLEETNQKIHITGIVYEDSNYDVKKDIIFTRLVYKGEILEKREILLDPEEHTQYALVKTIPTQEKVVDYLINILNHVQ
ncbi:DNA mismatch repair protein MutT [Enterococcus sp. CU12B]|uniref:DNA mismatch repair protein MutT n=1 Tax=Candidatus Enterococcus willemsii TaxID=1857215 RepID=A0ABQ6Z1K3_9ENTE|nr:NUDIX hydrolase [Enterococcus sp. CU12B]KAF1305016.1 DNA mismatch repair protein MutT [Enterococcus sp. CU12B]